MATWDPKGMVLEPADVQEAPYQGRAGATRAESVHVPLADGTLRTVSVYRAVNVATDPQLREPALTGALHRLDGGVELALPFVYHDPAARRLALVLPEALRHEELRERARLLERLAEDTSVPVPRYAADAKVVIGLAQLASYLESASHRAQRAHDEAELNGKRKELGQREQALIGREEIVAGREAGHAQREQQLAAREQQLAAREQRMRERAEEVTRREDELASQSEEHEAAQRDLAMREQELEQRLESLVQRERALAERHGGAPALADGHGPGLGLPRRALSSRPPPAPGPGAPLSAGAGALGLGMASALEPSRAPRIEPVADAEDPPLDRVVRDAEAIDDEVEELDDLEPIRTNPGVLPEPIATISTDAVEELVDDDDVEEEVDEDDLEPSAEAGLLARDDEDDLALAGDAALDPRPTDGASDDDDGEGPKTMIASARDVALAAGEVPGSSTEPGIARPAELGGEVEMIARAGDGVELFVDVGESADAFEGETDLLIQLVVLEGCPVVLLALVDPTRSRPFVRRAAFDPRTPEGRRLLEALRRRFEARTVLFGADGRFLRTGRVAAPRELNAARTLDRVSRLRAQPAFDPATAIERVLAAPPPFAASASGGSPFSAEEEKGRLDTAARALAALIELAEWSSPEKMDHALLVLSVPRDTIDATFARVMERSVEHGLALPSSLVDRAIGAGLADDLGALVARQIDAFRRTVELPDRGGLDDEPVASNWEKLLAAAADAEVAIDAATHDLAWRAIRVVRGESTGSMPGGDVDPARLAEMGPPELVMLLEHPRHRRAAALALADRGDPAFADALCKAVRKMPRAEVVRVVPRIAKIGDEAGDALIDGLGARKTFARQAFALALGSLKLRRAVVPLLHLLGSEPTDVWKEIARVYGTFGNASFRTLSQKLQDPKAPEERYVLTLAHLANHGCAKQVDALTKDSDPHVSSLAVRALALRDDARRQDELVSGKRPLDGADGVIAFSRRFVEELEGTAPEGDLAAVPGEDV